MARPPIRITPGASSPVPPEYAALLGWPTPLARAPGAPGEILFGEDRQSYGRALLEASRGREAAAALLAGGPAVRLGVSQVVMRRGTAPAYAIRIEGNATCSETGCDTEIQMPSGGSWTRIFRDSTLGLAVTAYDASSGMARLEDQLGRRWEWDGRGYVLAAAR